jgi:hypothetical protein
MIIRELDIDGDWTFGKGKNNYLREKKALMLNLKTRILSFLGDCFFDLISGINWFNLLGSKDQLSLKLAISTTILNTPDITGIMSLNLSINPRTRAATIIYSVSSTYGAFSSSVSTATVI